MVELLAPAGSFESVKAAVSAGADAVYMGGSRFGARAFAESVEEGRTQDALDYVHFHGRKLYLTVNTLVKERELDQLPGFLMPYVERGLDGVIVQDMGVWRRIRECFSGLPVHISTQMTLTGSWGARWMETLGASRIVLARELSLEEIRLIRKHIGIEIEAFVHGAICYCYSGQCLMSSMIGGRSGNRGRCAQPCRLPYGLNAGKDRKYFLNLKDMCTVEHIPELAEAGVNSMKIEGRMKSPVYTAGVVSVYRKYLDRYLEYGREHFAVEQKDMRILSELFDRGGFTDYLYRRNGREMMTLEEKSRFRQVDQTVIDAIESQYILKEPKRNVCGTVTLEKEKPAKIVLECDGAVCQWEGAVVEAAKARPLTEETARKQLGKTGNSEFSFEKLEIYLEEGCFFNIQALNELRRQGLAKLREELIGRNRNSAVKFIEQEKNISKRADENCGDRDAGPDGGNPSITVLLPDFSGAAWIFEEPEVNRVILEEGQQDDPERLRELAEMAHSRGKELFFRLPPILRDREADRLWKRREMLTGSGLDGLVVRTADEAGLVCEGGLDIPVALDHSFYTWNRQALEFVRQALGRRMVFETLPLELNRKELEQRGCAGGELVAYGYMPLMVTAGCIGKTGDNCDHREKAFHITDRKQMDFPVKTLCKSCCNVIYNARPLYLLDQMDSVRSLGPASVRLEFSVESRKEQRQLVRKLAAALKGRADAPAQGTYTRGHFRRGVD